MNMITEQRSNIHRFGKIALLGIIFGAALALMFALTALAEDQSGSTETTAPESELVVEETTPPEEEPAVDETTPPEEPLVDETAAPEEQPVVEETTVPDTEPVVEETTASGEEPVIDEIAAPEEELVEDELQLDDGTEDSQSSDLFEETVIPTITTDKLDYQPGDIVVVTGSGWQSEETVKLTFDEIPYNPPVTYYATADDEGNIYNTQYVIEERHLGSTIALTAVGQTSGLTAQTIFTDTPDSVLTVNPASGTFGGTVTLSATLTKKSADTLISGKSIDFTLNGVDKGSATTNASGVATLSGVSLAGIAVGTYTNGVGASFAGDTGAGGYNSSSGTASLTVTPSVASTNLTVSSATGTYGGTGNLSATLTSGDSPVSGKSIDFTLNGVDKGSATTNASGVATLSGVSLAGIAVGTYTTGVGASFAGDSNYSSSSDSASLTITPAPITVTAAAKSKVYGDADPALTYSITSGSLVGGDSFSGTLTRVSGEGVGTYAIQQGTLALSSNYDLTYVGANLTITPAPVAIAPSTTTPLVIAGIPEVAGVKKAARALKVAGITELPFTGSNIVLSYIIAILMIMSGNAIILSSRKMKVDKAKN